MSTISSSWFMKKMNRLSYSQKFIIISMLFAISLVVSGYFMIVNQNATINLAKRERKGIIYIRALQKLMQDLPEHEWQSYSYLSGNAKIKSELLNLSTEIGADFKYLVDIDQELQTTLATTSSDFQARGLDYLKPSQLIIQWDELDKRLTSLTPEESSILHDKLIANLRSLMLYVGETANLILDPTIELTYYVQNLLWNLPKAQSIIAKIIIAEQSLLNTQKASSSDKDQLLIQTALLQLNIKDTKSSVEKSDNALKFAQRTNESINNPFKISVNNYYNITTAWLAYVEENLMHNPTPPKKSSEKQTLATQAMDANTALWNVTADQFNIIINKRIANFNKQQLFSIAASIISAIIGLTLGIYIMRQISRPLTNLVEAAKQLTDGNLSARVSISEESEVGQVGIAFNNMAEAFQDLLSRLQRNGTQLTNSTREIAAAATQQEASIVQQETTTKQIATTVRDISATAKEFAKTMNTVSTNAEQTSALASSGKEGLHQMESVMRQMVEASHIIAGKLAILNEKASNITGVITTITKVADQTNLLSLNAAIEAEKAGEHGRTFSVIAREIRRLADQTGNATLDIEKMVNEMLTAVSAGVMSVDKFSEEIQNGVSQATNVGEQLNKIIEQVQHQTKSFETVNKGVQAQSVGGEQINKSIDQLSDAAHQASKSVRQFHKAIEELNLVTQEMQTSVNKIKH